MCNVRKKCGLQNFRFRNQFGWCRARCVWPRFYLQCSGHTKSNTCFGFSRDRWVLCSISSKIMSCMHKYYDRGNSICSIFIDQACAVQSGFWPNNNGQQYFSLASSLFMHMIHYWNDFLKITITYFLLSNWSSFFFAIVFINKFCRYLNMASCLFPSCLTRCLIACRHSILIYIDYDDKDLR